MHVGTYHDHGWTDGCDFCAWTWDDSSLWMWETPIKTRINGRACRISGAWVQLSLMVLCSQLHNTVHSGIHQHIVTNLKMMGRSTLWQCKCGVVCASWTDFWTLKFGLTFVTCWQSCLRDWRSTLGDYSFHCWVCFAFTWFSVRTFVQQLKVGTPEINKISTEHNCYY